MQWFAKRAPGCNLGSGDSATEGTAGGKSPDMLSIIIPTLNSERGLVSTLPVLVPGAMSGLVREVVIADGGSTDGTLAIADGAGCVLLASPAPLGQRLHEAATAARSPWLMFLRPGTVLDPGWIEDTGRFVEEAEAKGETAPAAVFRRSVPVGAGAPAVREALALLAFGLFGRVGPGQGLVIGIPLYKEMGGHREAADTETDLLARLGRRRIVMLRSGART